MDREKEIDDAAKKIWEYMHMHQKLKHADCILVLCSYDVRVADWAAKLYLQGWSPYIMFSGGLTGETEKRFSSSEAEVFAKRAESAGVPREKIIVENKSKNTADNIERSKEVLRAGGFDFHSFILVQKPSNERRSYASFRKWWPEKECIVTSPPISYDDYPNEEISKELMINNMVGDFQRVSVYAERGWQIPQEIPQDIWQAYAVLVERGFTTYVIKE